MVHVVAANQTLTAIGGTASTIYSDPLPLGENDRATVTLMVHYLWATGGGSPSGVVAYMAEVSNDGVYWVDDPAVADQATGPTVVPKLRSAEVGWEHPTGRRATRLE